MGLGGGANRRLEARAQGSGDEGEDRRVGAAGRVPHEIGLGSQDRGKRIEVAPGKLGDSSLLWRPSPWPCRF